MTTHIILDAIDDTDSLLTEFRNSPETQLILELGTYYPKGDSYVFVPGVDKDTFQRSLWFIGTCSKWVKKGWKKQEIDFYWTDPSRIHEIHKKHKESSDSKDLIHQTQSFSGKFPETKHIQKNQKSYIRGNLIRSQSCMTYKENMGREKTSDLYCKERLHSFRIKTRVERNVNSDIAAPIHLSYVEKFSFKRAYIHNLHNTWIYQHTICRTGNLTKHDTIKSGQTSYHIEIKLLRNMNLLQAKNNISLGGDFAEKGIDLLIRGAPYSLTVLKPLSINFRELWEQRPLELQDIENQSNENDNEHESKINSSDLQLNPVKLILKEEFFPYVGYN